MNSVPPEGYAEGKAMRTGTIWATDNARVRNRGRRFIETGAVVLALLAAAVLAPVTATAQQVWFVDETANGVSDGTSWSNAFVDFQDALTAAAPNHEIWVAGGIYRPSERTAKSLVRGDELPVSRPLASYSLAPT